MTIQKQEWKEYTRYIISDGYGSVMINLYNKPQECGSKSYTAWIWGLYVCPEHRRKGHAKLLLKEAERIALENGHKDVYMEWDAKETSRDILDFYVRNGYEIASDEVVLCKKNDGGQTMIDVKTLHIGSHVEYKGKIVRICSLKTNMANYDDGKGKPRCFSSMKAYYKDLQPIPITPELLEKIGFEYRDDTYWERWYLGSFNIERKEHSSYFDYDVNIRLKYLHELENLYYMIYGKELKTE